MTAFQRASQHVVHGCPRLPLGAKEHPERHVHADGTGVVCDGCERRFDDLPEQLTRTVSLQIELVQIDPMVASMIQRMLDQGGRDMVEEFLKMNPDIPAGLYNSL